MPWEALKAGDTVRIAYSATPYKGKFLIAAKGTASAPVRVCGIKGPNGERPIIDGNGAVSRPALAAAYGSTTLVDTLTVRDYHEQRSIIVIKPLATSASAWTDVPSYIQIDGLNIARAHPNYTFTNTAGVTKNYIPFGAAIWVERGWNVTIRDNEISDSSQGIYSKSTDDGDFAVTKNLLISNNYLWGHGIVGDVHMHSTYTESQGIVIEGNHYGPLRAGALGNAIKDRSAGTVVRYNRIKEGAHSIDLVEAEDFPKTAMADPAYRTTTVYGNIITKTGDTGSVIHYGGDHYGSTPGAAWGEGLFRKGKLYFWNNTVYLTGTQGWIFQLATTEEVGEVWSNALIYAPSMTYKMMRMDTSGIGASWTSGGTLNLRENVVSADWTDSDPWHKVNGVLSVLNAQIPATSVPFDLTTFIPVLGGPLVDNARPTLRPDVVLNKQTTPTGGIVDRHFDSANDAGAIELVK